MYRTQITTTEVNAYVAEVRSRVTADGLPFTISTNRQGFHARCKDCGEGFSESRGTVTIGTLQRHALEHAAA